MKKTEDKAQKVGRASDPGLYVNIGKILVPLDKVNQMSHLLDLPVNDFVYVEG